MDSKLLKVLSIRPFLFLWLAEVFTQIAINMVNFALIVVAFEITKSSTAVSGIILSFTIPAIFFGVIAGVFVDRWNKKTVLIITNVFRFILLFLLAYFHSDLFLIYLLSLLIAIVTQFFIPAETPMVPQLVKKNLLLSANSLFGLGIYGSILIAYALSGPVIVFLGNFYIFSFLAVLFLFSAFLVTLIKVPKNLEGEVLNIANNNAYNNSISSFIEEIKHAFSVITKKSSVYHSLVLLTLSQVLFLIVAVIGPSFATQILKVSVTQFPILFITPATIGMVAGAFFLGHFVHNKKKGYIVNIGIFASAVSFFLLPNIAHFSFLLNPATATVVLAFFMGLANALVFIPSNTIVQEEIVSELRGKVYGFLSSMVGLFSLFPVVLAGGFSDIFGVGAVLIGIGVFILFFGFIKMFF